MTLANLSGESPRLDGAAPGENLSMRGPCDAEISSIAADVNTCGSGLLLDDPELRFPDGSLVPGVVE